MTKGICFVCKARTDVTKHHVKEIPKKPDGTYESITLCDKCHVFHEKYVNALKSLGYDPDKMKVTRKSDVKNTKSVYDFIDIPKKT